MRNFVRIFISLFVIFGTGFAFSQGEEKDDIEIQAPWIRATAPAAKVGGGYFSIINNSTQEDRLLGATSQIADRVEIHYMEMTDGIMKMRPIPEGLVIPAGQKIELAPGGYHLMLIGLKQPVKQNDTVAVALKFEKAGIINIVLLASQFKKPAFDHKNSSTSSHDGGK